MELTAGIHRNATLFPDRPALIGPQRRLDWAGLRDRVARLAAVLHRDGVAAGDRVALLGENTEDLVELLFACLWAGAVPVPVNTRWAAPEVAACLADCSPVLLLADAACSDLAAAALRLPDATAVTGGSMADTVARSAGEPALADARRGGDDLAVLFYTGGTTGRAKGVMLSHNNLMANSMMAVPALELHGGSVHLHTSPLFHVAGGARLFSVTVAAATHVVLPRFDELDFLATIEREQVTVTVVVPTMLNRLVQHPDLERYRLGSLSLLCYGASPMPEAVLRAARQRLPGVRFLQSYGMTELSPVATMLRPEQHVFEGPGQAWLRSAGQPVVNAEVAIHGPDGQPLATGEVGEVVVRGPMVMQGYWQQPERTAEVLRDGWLATGDAGRLDGQGFLYLVDRVKDMIVSGGENVWSAEVEDCLHSHPAVRDCAVIGIPHDDWGEQVHALVVLAEGQQPEGLAEALAGHCRQRLAGFKCPRSWVLQQHDLPRSGVGKVLKAQLRQPFWQEHSRGVN